MSINKNKTIFFQSRTPFPPPPITDFIIKFFFFRRLEIEKSFADNIFRQKSSRMSRTFIKLPTTSSKISYLLIFRQTAHSMFVKFFDESHFSKEYNHFYQTDIEYIFRQESVPTKYFLVPH